MRALNRESRGTVDRIERRRIRPLRRLTPRHEPVFRQQDELRLRVLRHRFGNELRERETGTEVWNPHRIGAEALLGEALAIARADDRADRVGVRVIDVRVRHERVQQSLDRRTWHQRIQLAACEIGDHLLVAHRIALCEREDLVDAQPGEAAPADRGEVAAGALHPQHRQLAARVIELARLDGRVPAAEVHDPTFGCEQVRAVDERVELGQAGGRIPTVFEDRRNGQSHEARTLPLSLIRSMRRRSRASAPARHVRRSHRRGRPRSGLRTRRAPRAPSRTTA